ncbi:MAG: DUF6263 family protein [Planctomycetota bacterium]
MITFRNRTPWMFALALALLVSATADAGKPLKWKLQKGQKFDVVVETSMQQQQNISGQQVDTDNQMKMVMTWDVLDVDSAGVATIEQEMGRITMDMKSPMGEIKFDSEDEEEPSGMAAMLASAIKPMVGIKFVQKLSPYGENLGVEVVGQEDGAAGQGPMNPDMLKQMANSAQVPFPEAGVEANETWTAETEVDVPPLGKATTTSTYEYLGEEQRGDATVDVIQVAQKTDFPKSDEPNAMGMKIDVEDSSSTGKLYFNAEKGHLVGSEIEQKMTATIEAMGQTIDQVQTTKTTTTVTPR